MRTKTRGAAAYLTFTRPEKLNAFDAAEWLALHEAVRAAEREPGVRAVVLRGEGRAFCAGNDIGEFTRLQDADDARHYFVDQMLPAFEALATSPLPVIAAVHGLAYGGGLELVQFSDVAVAAQGTRFRLPEARIGVWATVFCGAAPYTCGPRGAKLLALTGREVEADEARSLGLVDLVVPDAELDDAVASLVADVAAGAPGSLAYTKRFANRELVARGLPAVRDALLALVDDTLPSADRREGTRAFRERRDPVWGTGAR